MYLSDKPAEFSLMINKALSSCQRGFPLSFTDFAGRTFGWTLSGR